MKNILILIGTAVLIGCAGVCLAADAQDSKTESKSANLEPVIVTASRIEKKLYDVPSNVSVVSEGDIEASDAKSVPDLLKGLEGVYAYDPSGVGVGAAVNMRGFWGSMSTYQLVLVDGIPQNKASDKLVDWDFIPLNNIKRVEVLRGPASSLYGDGAMAGVINIITKKPTMKPETKFSGSYGSFNTQNYNVSTSGVFKKLCYLISAARRSTDGFRKNCGYGNFNTTGKFEYSITENHKLKVFADYNRKTVDAFPWALTEAQILADRRMARPGSEDDSNKTQKVDSSVTYNGNFGEISSLEGTFYYRYEGGDAFYTATAAKSSTTEQFDNENTYGMLSRLNVKPEIFGLKCSFTGGFDFEIDSYHYKDYAAPFKLKRGLQSDYGVRRDKVAPYFQGEVKIFDPLKVVAGIRYDSIGFNFGDHRLIANSKDKSMSKASPNCGLVYTYGESSSFYASYAQAFRTPTTGQMFTYGSSANLDLNPEEATNYELGLRHQLWEGFRVNTTLYWMSLDNEIWYDYAQRRYQNCGKTSHKGVETGVSLRLFKGLGAFFNYTYTRAKNKSGDFSGKYLTNIPLHKWDFGVRYETDFGLKANLMFVRPGQGYIDSANEDKLAGYGTVDAKVIYEHKWWEVFFAVNNLFDEQYNSYGYDTTGGTKYFSPAPERTMTVGAGAKF